MKILPETSRLRLRQRGSALIAVILFVVCAVMILGSLMPSMMTEYHMNIRHKVQTSALATAEYGARHAIWCLNELLGEEEWQDNGWTLATDSLGREVLTREIVLGSDSHFSLEGGDVGRARVTVRSLGHYSAQVISHGLVERAGGAQSGQQIIAITLGTTSPFVGLIARDSLSFQGQPRFDSFNSDLFPFYYSSGVNTSQNVTVGSVSSASGSVSLGNAHVFGNVVSGASDPLASGAVSGGSTITGDIIGDFNQELPPVQTPDTTGWLTSF